MATKTKSALSLLAQEIATEVSAGANTAARVGGLDQDIIDSYVHTEDPPENAPVAIRYADIAGMIAAPAQALQVNRFLYSVESAAAAGIVGRAYYEYKGVATGALSDYNFVSSEVPPLANYVDVVPQGTPPVHSEARFFYHDVKKNFVFYNDRPDVAMDLGRELWTRAVNKTGTGTTDAKAVYVSGGSANLPEVSLAKADTAVTSEAIGLFTEDVAIDGNGEVASFGLINDVDTSSWSAGDLLYLSEATAGELTNVKPPVPNFEVVIGYVIKSDASAGILWIHSGNILSPVHKSLNSSWSSFNGATAATNYLNGFYSFETAITPAGGTNLGVANAAHDAHVYFVLGAASTDMVIRVSGTSYNDTTGRTATDTEDIDTSGGVLGDYFETTKKWIGLVSITLQSGTGVITAYGWASYWDNRNTQFVVSAFEWTGRAGANDAAPNIYLFHHKPTGWTYGAGGATPPPAVIDMQTEYVTEYQFGSGEYFKFKKIGISAVINGASAEGIIIGIDINAANSIASSNIDVQIISR